MNSEEWFKEKLDRFKDDVDFLTEKAILGFTEQVVSYMEKNNINRAELAKRLNVSKAFVTKLLNGNPNLTIKTMVSLAKTLDCDLRLELRAEHEVETKQKRTSRPLRLKAHRNAIRGR